MTSSRKLGGAKYKWDERSRPLWSWMNKRRCAQCYGKVRDRQKDDGTWELYCPKGCEPGGHVSEAWVDMKHGEAQITAEIVAQSYPDLEGAEEYVRDEPTEEEAKDASDLLFGE